MRLTQMALHRFAEHLNGGALVLYSGAAPVDADAETFPNVLVECELPYPAFVKQNGHLILNGPVDAEIAKTGDVGWGQLLAPTREVLADLIVRAEDAEDASTADILVERTDFQRGGRCTITNLTLRLPQ